MKSNTVFSINEESESGGCSHCWVEQKANGYFLYGGEVGEMTGPCDSILEALNRSGHQFGMDYCDIQCIVAPEELREILNSAAFILSNFSRLTINDEEVNPLDVRGVIDAYRKQKKVRSK